MTIFGKDHSHDVNIRFRTYPANEKRPRFSGGYGACFISYIIPIFTTAYQATRVAFGPSRLGIYKGDSETCEHYFNTVGRIYREDQFPSLLVPSSRSSVWPGTLVIPGTKLERRPLTITGTARRKTITIKQTNKQTEE